MTSEPPKYSNLNSPNLLLWFFCLINSRTNHSGITQPFLNPNISFVCSRIIKKNQNKDLENSNSNILEFRCREQVIWQLGSVCSLTKYNNNAFEYVDFWPKIYLILNPSFRNLTTQIAIILTPICLNNYSSLLEQFCSIQVCTLMLF